MESNGSISVKELFHNAAFLMFTQRIFDREEQSHYEIHLQADDHGAPKLSNTFNFTLIVLDENDNAPAFDQPSYTINISETVPAQTVLFHFHAADADEPNTLNSQIEYRLDNQTIFALDSMSGALSLVGQLDRELESSYELDITAFDHGQPHSLSSTVRCTIHLIDMNDNYPVFDVSDYVFEIAETWPNLSPIGHVHATDADEYYRDLSYRLVYNDNTSVKDEWPFLLTSNGTLSLKGTSAGQ